MLTTAFSMGAVSVYTVPIKSTSEVYVFIIDNEQKRVVFHDKSIIQGEPLKEKVLTSQVETIFKEL